MSAITTTETIDWQDQIFAVLKAEDIRQVGYVPDAGHAQLIELCRGDPAIRAVPLTPKRRGWLCSPAPGLAASVASC